MIGDTKQAGPLRVLHVIGRLIPGGVEVRTLELIRRTQGDEFEHFVCLTSGRAGTLDEEYRAAGARLVYENIFAPLFIPRFARYLRRHGIDVVHSNIMAASALPLTAARLANVPNRITHFRTDGDESKANPVRRLRQATLRAVTSSMSTQIVGLTPMNLTAAWSPDWRSDPRTSVVANGVPIPSSDAQASPEFSSFGDAMIILHVGRGEIRTKNREKAIRVLAELRRMRPDAHLFFVGRDGVHTSESRSVRTAWEQLARDTGNADHVHFLGERSDVNDLMRAASALLMTSSLEGLPGVVLEALSNGLPVVSSDVPGAVFISEHADDITLCRVDDPDGAWAAALLRLPAHISPLRRRAAIDRMHGSYFDIEIAIQRYRELWTRPNC